MEENDKSIVLGTNRKIEVIVVRKNDCMMYDECIIFEGYVKSILMRSLVMKNYLKALVTLLLSWLKSKRRHD